MKLDDEIREFKRMLFEEYGGFLNKQYRNIDSYNAFAVDGRSHKDLDSRKRLYATFCALSASVEGPKCLHLELSNCIPDEPPINEWIRRNGIEHRAGKIRLDIRPKNLGQLEELSDAFLKIIAARGYSEKYYKHLCPRTSASLLRLSGVLTNFWAER